jgi:prepilin-type N-terminal cleavage/methylation domain-containing protein
MKKRAGFTLIELSVVLIIIGLIVGGVLKGTDMINSAKQKKFYNSFVKSWQIAVSQYQDRTGNILGDGNAPINNGGTVAANNGAFDNFALSAGTTVQARLSAVGIEIPTTNTNNSGSYFIEGKYVSSTVTIGLYNFAINGAAKNCIYLAGVPTDVALALDTMVDGTADAGLGNLRQWNVGATAANPTTLAWPDAKTTTLVNVAIVL